VFRRRGRSTYFTGFAGPQTSRDHQEFRRKRQQISPTIAAGDEHRHYHPAAMQPLLEQQTAIHPDEDVELALDRIERLPIRQLAQALLSSCVDVTARNGEFEATRDVGIWQDPQHRAPSSLRCRRNRSATSKLDDCKCVLPTDDRKVSQKSVDRMTAFHLVKQSLDWNSCAVEPRLPR
jgi:hypothetical protein